MRNGQASSTPIPKTHPSSSKRFGIGYTLNFGNPWAWVVVIFILLAIALPIILSNTSVLQLIK